MPDCQMNAETETVLEMVSQGVITAVARVGQMKGWQAPKEQRVEAIKAVLREEWPGFVQEWKDAIAAMVPEAGLHQILGVQCAFCAVKVWSALGFIGEDKIEKALAG